MEKVTKLKRIENKKGDFNILIAMIVIIIAGIILIAFFVYLMVMSKSVSDTEKCRMSALAKWKSRVVGTDSPLNLECKTDFIIVYNDRVEKNELFAYELRQGRPDYVQDGINRAIANEMYDCWYQLGSGNYDILGGGASRCIVCNYIDFDESFRVDNARFTGLSEMLTKKIPGHNISYVNYLTQGGISNEQLVSKEVSFDTSKSYVIIYIPVSSSLWKLSNADYKQFYETYADKYQCKTNESIVPTGEDAWSFVSACGKDSTDTLVLGIKKSDGMYYMTILAPVDFAGEQCTIMY